VVPAVRSGDVRSADNFALDVELFGEPDHERTGDAVSEGTGNIDQSQSPRSDVPGQELPDHLAAVFGDEIGFVFLGVGSEQYITSTGKVKHGAWRETPYAWPRQADELTAEVLSAVAAGADVYFTPSLSANPLRNFKKRKRLPVSALWADLDDNPHPKHRRARRRA